MAASECAKFCVVLFTIAIALVSASKSDIRKDVIDVQDYITLRNLVKELQVTLKVHESRFEMLENRLLQSERKTDLLVRERKRNLQVINELSRHLSGIENKEAQIKPFASKKIRRENVQEDVSKIRKGTIMMFHVTEYWCVSNHGNMIQKPSKQIGDLKTSKGIHNVWR